MPVIRKKRRIFSFVHSARPWLLGFVGLAALGYFFYFLTTLGPRRIGDATAEVKRPDDPELAKLSDEIGDLEQQYQKVADAGLMTTEAIDKLAVAFDKQRALMRLYPNAGMDQSARLVRLETALGDARAKLTITVIDGLTKDAMDALDNSDSDLATAKFTEALRLQREINASSAGPRYKNYVRETSISQQLGRLAAAPLQKEVDASVALARKAALEKRWSDALAAYTNARALQDRINREYGSTTYSDLSAVDTLDSEIESLNAAGVAADIDAKEKAGDDAFASGNAVEAAACFATAGTLQLEVNQKFPKSRFVSSGRIESLETKRQTALSTPEANALAELDLAIGAHLRKRQVVLANEKIAAAQALVDKLFSSYPKSTRIDGALKIKIAYLSLRRADLRPLQDELYDRMLPLPTASDRLLLKTEVPQSLYVQVMNTNPSRNPGREFPVDSVNLSDAQDFCLRLSWLLGATVRLPTMDEFRVALGDGQPAAWSHANSQGHSHEVGQGTSNHTGFYDLVGNLAEWTAAASGDDKALVFGGSYQDEQDVLRKIPSEARLKSDRARQVGFRIIVDLSAR